MTINPISIDTPDLWATFTNALTASNLPTEDLGEAGQHFFTLGNGEAFGGYLLADETILVRSVVVPQNTRRQGVGARMANALLDAAKADGARSAWLLTNSAAPFFEALGFNEAPRATAPAAIAATPQFAGICPANAKLLRKDL